MKKVLALVLCAMLMLASVSALAESGEKVHLEFFNIKPEVVDILNTLIDKFEAENPDTTWSRRRFPTPPRCCRPVRLPTSCPKC